MVDPRKEWVDIDTDVCGVMARLPQMVGVGVSCGTGSQRIWGPYELDDVEFSSRPTLYRTRTGAEKARDRLIAADVDCGFEPPRDWVLTLWVAPEHEWDEVPLGKYVQMNGWRLPGTPRR